MRILRCGRRGLPPRLDSQRELRAPNTAQCRRAYKVDDRIQQPAALLLVILCFCFCSCAPHDKVDRSSPSPGSAPMMLTSMLCSHGRQFALQNTTVVFPSAVIRPARMVPAGSGAAAAINRAIPCRVVHARAAQKSNGTPRRASAHGCSRVDHPTRIPAALCPHPSASQRIPQSISNRPRSLPRYWPKRHPLARGPLWVPCT